MLSCFLPLMLIKKKTKNTTSTERVNLSLLLTSLNLKLHASKISARTVCKLGQNASSLILLLLSLQVLQIPQSEERKKTSRVNSKETAGVKIMNRRRPLTYLINLGERRKAPPEGAPFIPFLSLRPAIGAELFSLAPHTGRPRPSLRCCGAASTSDYIRRLNPPRNGARSGATGAKLN